MLNEKPLADKVKAVNALLKAGEPSNWSTDHKGYAGYKPQSIIDAVNTELIGDWSVEVIDKDKYLSARKDKNGNAIQNVVVWVKVTLSGTSFTACASHPIIDDIGDAWKSAQTDATKKALSHFSIGNRAYHGLLTNK